MKPALLAMAFFLFSLFAAKAQNNLSVEDFQKALTPDTRLIDVRTDAEFKDGHLRGAVNYDWFQKDFTDRIKADFSKDTPLYVYCRSGKRSAAAAEKLTREGYTIYNMLGGYQAWTKADKEVTRYEVERFFTASGKALEITLVKHGSLELRYEGLSIQIDPVTELGKKTDYAKEFPKADIILVTHEHGDHYDPEAIRNLSDKDTELITNARCAQMMGYGTVMANGDALSRGFLHIAAVPAYNTTEGHLQFHPKGRDDGFVLTADGLRIYLAGDTEDIPEMGQLENIDIVFLPVNQPYTMTVEQCIRAAKIIRPRILIPYHFGQTDITPLPEALPGIDVRLRQMQ